MLASGLALSAAAQTPAATAPAGPVKIAIIAFQAAVGQTNEFQRSFADLQKKYEVKEAPLKTRNDEIETLKKELQAQGDKLSAAERSSKTKAIDDKTKQLQRAIQDVRNDFQQEMQETFNTVASKVGEVLVGYAQQQGYTVVLDWSQSREQAPLVLYASPSADITKAITEAYNVKSGVPAPPPQPAAAAPKPPAAH
jgi:outer membrane protein